DWMRSLQPSQPSSSAMPAGEPVAPSSKGFSARDLLDEQSLPSWMGPQNGQAAAPNTGQPAQPGFLSPSSLIDQNALPNWMQEGGNAASRVPSPPLQSSLSWQAPRSPAQPPMQSPFAQNAAGPNSGLAASSFVDTNSLPDWMQSGA